jgi:tRNA(Ile)-lysidine synthase
MESSRNLLKPDFLQAAVLESAACHIRRGTAVVVGFSGGLDSTALLHCLQLLRPALEISLSAVHVHHGISEHADSWAAHCEAVCSKMGVELRVSRVLVERASGDGLEAAARRARHATYNACGEAIVALAHHRYDQAETLLFNLLRGCGINGATAMRPINGKLWRPLLGIGRDVIQNYANSHGLQWVVDESNADTRMTRNFLRHNVLPVLEARFSAAQVNLASAARRFAEAADMLDDLALADAGHDADFPLEVSALASLSEPRARNVLRFLLHRHHVGIPSEEKLREIVRQMLTAAPDRHPAIELGEYVLRRSGGRVELTRNGS